VSLRKSFRATVAVLSLVMLPLLAACATVPTEAELAKSIIDAAAQDPNLVLTPEQATCISQQILASGLSDTTLDGLADNFAQPDVLGTEVGRIADTVTAAATACGT